ncbi:membrane protein required for colicin V production [Erythrobacter litoralis]|jgi:membrane protein required for colicin V production|uniref:Colicin V production protein n=1 Tax=Erythrobacter litoralis TaxID=39960 RepID=A0A074N002_9SPHN|nr:CvpA family protein [Erythrobacter litoralis]AOL23538.1 membrane protein required for colicin V production [Erythrobacter litoralis]KEO98979.1 colicin V production protein [Erythrobacter litoralis]MEE4337988.1 CvpA family protein [Erythrobacter sp.]
MTGFDLIVLIVVGVAAIGGFLRGLVQEVLSLAAWVLAAFSIYYLHTPLTQALRQWYDAEPATPILAFALLLLIPYAAMKVIASNAGEASRGSILGPIDRVLGFGFGAVKGALIMVFAFSILVLGFDEIWSFKGRPTWITTARTYPAADAFSQALVQMIDDRRAALRAEEEAAAQAAEEQ